MDKTRATESANKILKQKVLNHLQSKNISVKRTKSMVFKSLLLVSLWALSYSLFLFYGQVSPAYALAGTLPWTFIMLVIQLAVMHDGSHGASSDSTWFNNLMTSPISFLGGSALLWKNQHCQAHHSFTNVHKYDHDIDTNGLLRLHTEQELLWYQKYQHIYAWALYPLFTLSWVWWGDFRDIIYNTYSISPARMKKVIVETVLIKIWHVLLFLVLPTYVFGSFGLALACYLISFSILGFCMVVIFQLAHATGTQSLPATPDEFGRDWVLRQVSTTSNFAIHNRALTWCIGGLNYQVEHHLFPTMCHLNYPHIQPIVEKFCEENKIEYKTQSTLFGAVRDHQNFLRTMGQTS